MDWQTLIPDAPSDWELLPLNGKKRPIDHNTGALLHDWTQSSGYDIDAICEMNGVVRAVGVKLGPASGGLLAVDFDGPGSTEKFQEVTGHSAADLPATIAVTSGKPHRQQRLFTVDRDWWDFLQGRRVFKQGNAIVLEFRWAGHQSAIAGDHPETNGYRWIDGASPADHEPHWHPIGCWSLWSDQSKSCPRSRRQLTTLIVLSQCCAASTRWIALITTAGLKSGWRSTMLTPAC